jgi:hypothetical protein
VVAPGNDPNRKAKKSDSLWKTITNDARLVFNLLVLLVVIIPMPILYAVQRIWSPMKKVNDHRSLF